MIPKELLKALRKIEITTNRLATEQLAGSYTSVFKGQGLAFREVREYQPGDDIRTIDWNVSARMDATHVKVFVEEREMTMMLVVDLSARSTLRHAHRQQSAARGRSRRAVRFQRHQAQRPRGSDPDDRSDRKSSCPQKRARST